VTEQSDTEESSVQGRIVLVTGAARGIGKEAARQLAELGATVLVSARDADHAQATAKELSIAGDVRALPVDLDVADDASVRVAAAALERDPGRVDVLVNMPPPASTGPRPPRAPTSTPPGECWR
jgi:NAD(P)-dependent dehydrogenase (short-subunit alcohol dehydrogenase family)